MPSYYRHRRTENPGTAFPNPLNPGEISVNTANRQLAVGDANAGTLGAPLPFLAVRFFDARASYLSGDIVVQSAIVYRANGNVPPGAFNVSNWTALADPATYVNVTGDTMTGHLALPTAPAAANAVRKDYVDAADATLQTYIDNKPALVISDAAPPTPLDNSMWWDSDTGTLYVRYNDGAGPSQWVQAVAVPAIDTTSFATKSDLSRNRIVNGAMQISQENADTAGAGHNFFVADQWASGNNTAATLSWQRVQVTTPKGSKYRFRVTVSVADATVGAPDLFYLRHAIEGNNFVDFRFGSASARQSILRFGWKSPAGTYSVSIINGAANRSYVTNFTIGAGQANTDTEQMVIIPGDTTGTWLTDAGVGFYLSIGMAIGSTFQGLTGWQAGNILGTASNTNGMATAGNVFEIFDVGLYLDTDNTGVPPKWQMPDPAQELLACQRYWRTAASAAGIAHSTTGARFEVAHYGMRATPTVSLAAAAQITDITTANPVQSAAAVTITINNADCGQYDLPNFTALTAARSYFIYPSSSPIRLNARM